MKNIKDSIRAGTYVIAVSGGVDSMVLLHLLTSPKVSEEHQFIVAHFNHGIRLDSKKDEELVKQTAINLGLSFESGHGKLGTNTSENQARNARYNFLEKVRSKHGASKIITAHHEDDLAETALINLFRGTGSRGLSSILVNTHVIRPLLRTTKKEVRDYALKNGVVWLEDSSNKETKYKRNEIRHKVMPLIKDRHRKNFIDTSHNVAKINTEVNTLIAKISQFIIKNNQINRYEYLNLPTAVSKEVLMHWLKDNNIRQFDRKMINRTDNAIRTAKGATYHPAVNNINIFINPSGKTVEMIKLSA